MSDPYTHEVIYETDVAVTRAVFLEKGINDTMVETYRLTVTLNRYDGGMYRGALVNTTGEREKLQATTREHTARAAAEKMAQATGNVATVTRVNTEFDAMESSN